MSKVVIFGSRGTMNDENYKKVCDVLPSLMLTTLVHGACPNSPDMFAERYAQEYPHIDVLPFPANWESYGKHAGFIRNASMARVEGLVLGVGVWDGKSNGTLDMAKQLIKNGVRVILIPATLDR